MNIDNKNYILDNEAYDMFQDNWKNNVNAFKSQNTAIIINKVEKLTEDIILKFINETAGKLINETDVLVDRQFINKYYDGLTVNPAVDEFKQNFTVQCNLRPDLSYVNLINKE